MSSEAGPDQRGLVFAAVCDKKLENSILLGRSGRLASVWARAYLDRALTRGGPGSVPGIPISRVLDSAPFCVRGPGRRPRISSCTDVQSRISIHSSRTIRYLVVSLQSRSTITRHRGASLSPAGRLRLTFRFARLRPHCRLFVCP